MSRTHRIDPQIGGFRYNKDPNKVPLISESLISCNVAIALKAKHESALQVQASAEQLQLEVERLKAEAAEALLV